MTRLMVMDANQPWVRSLFSAMPDGVEVDWFRPTALSVAARSGVRSFLASRRHVGVRVVERRFAYPGWGRFPNWSARVASRRLQRAIGAAGAGTTIVYTLPYDSAVAARLADVRSVYFAFDPYGAYDGWDAQEVAEREEELLKHCQAAFAISPALAEDFRRRTHLPVFVQANGISPERMASCQHGSPRPNDLPAGGKVACCVGQMGAAYDWRLIAEVADRCGDVTFVFVGPQHAMPADCQALADAALRRPNVRWLGAKLPEALPAYLTNADVLISPLAVTPANHRRSLLRIYDYLATNRPIVATPIASAAEHCHYLSLAGTAEDFAAAIDAALAEGRVDQAARHEYLSQFTWPRRAETFLANLERAGAIVG